QDLERQPDQVPVPPSNQQVPHQETGVRPARALPYTLHVHGDVRASSGEFRLHFRNSGQAGAVFPVRGAGAQAPRTYTVEANTHPPQAWRRRDLGGSNYDLSVFGPNGFYRRFKGAVSGRHHADLQVRAVYYGESNGITLEIANRASLPARVSIFNRYTSRATTFVLAPNESGSRSWYLTRFGGWYELTVTVEHDPGFQYVFAGH